MSKKGSRSESKIATKLGKKTTAIKKAETNKQNSN